MSTSTNTAQRHVRRADSLVPGDVIFTPWQGEKDRTGAPLDLAQVAHVEPVAGEPAVMVVFEGALSMHYTADEPVRVADDDTAAQWRSDVDQARSRHAIVTRLRRLAEQIAQGDLIVTTPLHVYWRASDRAALEQTAQTLGGTVEDHGSGATAGATVSVRDGYDAYVDVHWYPPRGQS